MKHHRIHPSFLFIICLLCTSLLVSGCGETADSTISGTVFELSDLPGKRIGVLTGSQGDLYATDLELPMGNEEPSVIERYMSLDTAVEDLRTGILDCVIMDAVLADEYCAADDHLAVLDEAFVWEEYAICLGPEQTELRDQLNQALAILEENGTLDEITSKYIRKEVSMEDFEDPEDPLADDLTDYSAESQNFADETTVLHVATTSGYEPYIFYDESGNLTGLDVDVAYALAKQLDMEIEITDMDYAELFSSVTDGSCQMAIAGIFPSEDLLETHLFTDSYTTACQMVLVRK